jgi:hypothetical protein
MQTLDDTFDAAMFHKALDRGSVILFDNAGVRVSSTMIECAYAWHAMRHGRALTTAAERRHALCVWIMEGRPDV